MTVNTAFVSKVCYAVALVLFTLTALGLAGSLVAAGLAFVAAGLLLG